MAKNIKRHISLLKSSGGTAPASADLIHGEIAVGYKKDNEALYILNSNNEVITFTTAAGSEAMAEAYTDDHVISTVNSDSALTTSLSEVTEGEQSGRTLSINHTTRTAQSGFKKLSTDAFGHVTAGTAVALSDLTGLGAVSTARTITTASGLTGGGNLSANRTIGLEAVGTSGTYFSVKTDAYGRVTSGKTSLDASDIPDLSRDYISTETRLATEKGLTGGGVLAGGLRIGHSNEITAGSAKTHSSSVTITPSGNDIEIPAIAYDDYGHITNTELSNVSLKVNSATSSTAGVVKIATTTGTNNTDTVMTQSAVTKAIEESFIQQDALVYKGLVGSGTNYGFPTTFSKGATYKVATAFTANSVSYEIGDMFIANTDVTTSENYTPSHWDAIQTNLDPTLYVNTATTVTGSGALGGGGNLSSNREITHNELAPSGTSGQTSPNAAQTPAFNATFNVPVIKYDKYGHITGTTTTTVKIPNSASTWNQNYYITGATTTTGTSNLGVSLSGNNTAAKASFTIPSVSDTAAGLMTPSQYAKLEDISSNYVRTSRTISTASGLTGGGSLLSDLTIGLSATGTSGTYKQVVVDAYGRVTSGNSEDSNSYRQIKVNGTVYLNSGSTTPLNFSAGSFTTVATAATGNVKINVTTGTSSTSVARGDHSHTAYTTSAFTTVSVVGDSTVSVVADQKHDTITLQKDDAITLSGNATSDTVVFGLGDIVCGDYA